MANNSNIEKTTQRITALRKLLKGKSSLLIVMQNNPDPDSIAAAMALRSIANKLGGLNCSIAHAGSVGRAENRAMVRYLGLNLRQMDDVDPSRFDLVAMVDTQPQTGNNALPDTLKPDIVIDHHPCRHNTRGCEFIDVRSRYGASATILFEYLQQLKIEIDTPLATALVYAIRSDTQDLGREANKADITAMQTLYPLANLKMLSDIQRGRVERSYFAMLSKALINAIACDKSIVTNLGEIENADMIAEVADILLRDDKAVWTLCYGFKDGGMLLSLRNCQAGKKAGDVMKKIVSRIGTGGGHTTMAGGQIPSTKIEGQKKTIEETVKRRFYKAINVSPSECDKLISS